MLQKYISITVIYNVISKEKRIIKKEIISLLIFKFFSVGEFIKNINNQTAEIDKPENGAWVNLVPPFKEEEFVELSDKLDIPIEFLRDSLDIDERPRYELDDNVRFIVIKTPAENNSFNDSDAYYITIPICIILTHNQIVTVNSFDNGAIKKFLNSLMRTFAYLLYAMATMRLTMLQLLR